MSSRPPARAGGFVLLLVVSCLVASPARAEERFHLFPEAEDPPPPPLRTGLVGLPPASPLAEFAAAPARRVSTDASSLSAESLPPYPTGKHFGAAAAEVAGLELFPFLLNRYVSHESWAYISMATVKYNLQTGFTWDNDPFTGNQASHSYHGSLYFNSARTNGYSFWESAPFAFAGSFLWELVSESQPPSINDLVNTTLGGMVWGEGQYRISNMILDNTASGLERFLREAGGLVLNPMGGFNRLIRGEMWKDFQNPADRLPSRLYLEIDGLYRHGNGSTPQHEDTDQGGLAFLLRYGDLFDLGPRKPFDYFELEANLLTPHATLLTEVVIRGLLVDWTLSGSPSAEQRLGLFLGTNYFNNEQTVYGAQAFGASHLMRVPLWKETELRTEAEVLGMPIVALGVDYRDAALNGSAGRSYDYGPGYGAQASARVRRREVDLLVLSWSLTGLRKESGISKSSRIETATVEARLPVTRNLVVGGGWSWAERSTTYDRFPTVDISGSAWRVFAGFAIPEKRDRPADPPSSSTVPAEPVGRWDVTAFGGGFFGTRVHTGSNVNVLMESAPTYGLRVGYGFSRLFTLEAGWSQASTNLRPTSVETGELVASETPVKVNTYELDGLFGFGSPAVRGYVGLGAGVQNMTPAVLSLDAVPPTTRFVSNVAAGGLFALTRQLALRVDGRYRFMASDNRTGAIVCDSLGCTRYATNLFSSAEITGGLTFRF